MSSNFQDDNGNKMVNEYVRECKIGSGSYGKVVRSLMMLPLYLFGRRNHCSQ